MAWGGWTTLPFCYSLDPTSPFLSPLGTPGVSERKRSTRAWTSKTSNLCSNWLEFKGIAPISYGVYRWDVAPSSFSVTRNVSHLVATAATCLPCIGLGSPFTNQYRNQTRKVIATLRAWKLQSMHWSVRASHPKSRFSKITRQPQKEKTTTILISISMFKPLSFRHSCKYREVRYCGPSSNARFNFTKTACSRDWDSFAWL